MEWLVIALLSYLALAVVGVVDKFILANVVTDARLYTFFIGVAGLIVLALFFFGVSWPGVNGFLVDLVSGAVIIVALALFYQSLTKGDASVVIPLVGGGVPVFVLILSYIFLDERLSARAFFAVFFLIVGGVIMTFLPKEKSFFGNFFHKKKPLGLPIALLSGFLFAVYFVVSKYTFSEQGFLTAFTWARIGSFAAVLLFFVSGTFRVNLVRFLRSFSNNRPLAVVGNQTLGALGFIGQNYAVSLSSATLINALQGVQYVFVLIIAVLVSLRFPHLIKEKVSGALVVEKAVAILFIGAGLYFIATAA